MLTKTPICTTTMAYSMNTSSFLRVSVCLACMIVTLLLSNFAEHIRIPYRKVHVNPIRLHTDSLKETTLKYQVLINEKYAERLLHLQRTCRNKTLDFKGDSTDQDVMHNIHIDENHNLLYCQIQKVGSTFIRTLLGKMLKTCSVKKRKQGSKRLSQRRDLGFAELHSVLQNADKFMFVREPYSRVLSGYVDKLFTPNSQYWKITGKYIISNIRENADVLSLKCGHDVKFTDFVKYIIQSEKDGNHTDRHFTPSYEHCRPCQISYDFIGKFEYFKEDLLFLVDVWNKGYGVNISVNDIRAKSSLDGVKSKGNRLFKDRKGILPCMSFYNASMRSWKNLQIRGIIPIKEPFPFSPDFTEHQMTKIDFISAAKKAIASVKDIESVRAQREEAFIEAYSMIEMEDLYKLQKVLKQDFKLFDYDPRPPKIFDRRNSSTPLKYFNI